MKKTILFCAVLGLVSCATTEKPNNGLTRLETEPKNCEYLYTLNTTSTTYKLADAYDYLEKNILEQKTIGDSYYVVNESVIDNAGAVFGPKHTFKFNVKVYNCNK